MREVWVKILGGRVLVGHGGGMVCRLVGTLVVSYFSLIVIERTVYLEFQNLSIPRTRETLVSRGSTGYGSQPARWGPRKAGRTSRSAKLIEQLIDHEDQKKIFHSVWILIYDLNLSSVRGCGSLPRAPPKCWPNRTWLHQEVTKYYSIQLTLPKGQAMPTNIPLGEIDHSRLVAIPDDQLPTSVNTISVA